MWSSGTVGDSQLDQLVGPFWMISHRDIFPADLWSANLRSSSADQFGNTALLYQKSTFINNAWVYRLFISTIDRTGALAWVKEITSPLGGVYGTKVLHNAAGDIYVQCNTLGVTDTITLIKVSGTDGTILWQKVGFTGGNLTIDGLGNLYTISAVLSGTASRYCAFVAKWDNDGNLVWKRAVNLTSFASNQFKAVAVSASGNVYCSGEDFASGFGQLVVVKFSSTGSFIWRKAASFPGQSVWSRDLALDSEENIYALGEANDLRSGQSYDCVLLKFNSSGTLLWNKTLGSTLGFSEQAGEGNGLSVDKLGRPIVAQNGGSAINVSNITAMDTDGTMLWSKKVTLPGGTNMHSITVSVDTSNNIYFSCYYYNGPLLFKFPITGLNNQVLVGVQSQNVSVQTGDISVLPATVTVADYPGLTFFNATIPTPTTNNMTTITTTGPAEFVKRTL